MLTKLAWVYGVVFVVLGVLAFVPSASSGGLLLGVFSVDTVLGAVYLIAGLIGLWIAWKSAGGARMYFKVFGIVFAIITILGFIEGDTVLGLTTVNMADNVLNLVAAAIALWAGFGAKADMGVQQQGMAM